MNYGLNRTQKQKERDLKRKMLRSYKQADILIEQEKVRKELEIEQADKFLEESFNNLD